MRLTDDRLNESSLSDATSLACTADARKPSGENSGRGCEQLRYELPAGTEESMVEKYRNARHLSELMIRNGEFDPIQESKKTGFTGLT
jgi:hypothetical protein